MVTPSIRKDILVMNDYTEIPSLHQPASPRYETPINRMPTPLDPDSQPQLDQVDGNMQPSNDQFTNGNLVGSSHITINIDENKLNANDSEMVNVELQENSSSVTIGMGSPAVISHQSNGQDLPINGQITKPKIGDRLLTFKTPDYKATETKPAPAFVSPGSHFSNRTRRLSPHPNSAAFACNVSILFFH